MVAHHRHPGPREPGGVALKLFAGLREPAANRSGRQRFDAELLAVDFVFVAAAPCCIRAHRDAAAAQGYRNGSKCTHSTAPSSTSFSSPFFAFSLKSASCSAENPHQPARGAA